MYYVEFKYFYIQHYFINALNILYINLTSYLCIKINVSFYE